MQKECPNDVPQPQAVSMVLMWPIALASTISHTAPLSSCHEKSGSSGPVGTIAARLCRPCRGQTPSFETRKTDCDWPAHAVLAEGRSSQAYGLPSRSQLNKVSFQDRCNLALNTLQTLTETSPKCIIPRKAQAAMAHTQASKGSDRTSVTLRACSI